MACEVYHFGFIDFLVVFFASDFSPRGFDPATVPS